MKNKIQTLRNKFVGLGEVIFSKRYFPLLKEKISELKIFQQMFEQMRVAIILVDATNLHIIDLNCAAANLLSIQKDTSRNKSIRHTINSELELKINIYLSRFKTLKPNNHTFTISQNIDNNNSIFEVEINSLLNDNNEILVLTVSDITTKTRTNEADEDRQYLLKLKNDQLQITEEELIATNEELMATNDALRESEEKYRRIFENSPLGIVFFDQHGIITTCNKAQGEILGAEPEKVIGLNLISDIKNEKLLLATTNVLKGQICKYRGEYKSVLSGKELAIHSTFAPIHSYNGQVIGGVGVTEDITVRLQAENELHQKNEELLATEEELREANVLLQTVNDEIVALNSRLIESRAYLRQIMDLVPHLIYVIDSEGTFLLANKAVADFYSTDVKQLKGKAIAGFHHHKAELEVTLAEIRQVLESNTPIIQNTEQFSNNNFVTYIMQITRIPFIYKNSVAVLNIAIDLTKEKENERKQQKNNELLRAYNTEMQNRSVQIQELLEKLKISESRYKSYINNAPDGIIVFTPQGEIVNINQAACEMLNIQRFKTHRNTLDNLLPENNNNWFVELLLNVEAQKKARGEISMQNSANESNYVLYEAVKLPDNDIILFLKDITQRKITEQELLIAKEKAEESDRLKSSFLANMSHEIRTPMNGIVGFASLLEDDSIGAPERQQYIEIINNNTTQLLTLISDIIDVSKMDSMQLQLKLSPVFLNSLLYDLYILFNEDKKRKEKAHLRIDLEVPPGTNSLKINTDEVRMNQILSNLLGNALKFTQQGRILFGYSIENSRNLLFFVKDTGIGISKTAQSFIFERFRQADETDTKFFGGSGLGLAISKGLVELLGGTIWVESEISEGTTFFFRIPFLEVS